MGRFYLKQINIVLKEAGGGLTESRPAELKGAFQERQRQLEDLMQRLDGQVRVIVTDSAAWEKPEDGCGILWLTDCPDAAEILSDQKKPVVAWLHEDNRHCSFPNVRYAVEDPQEADADFYEKIYRRYVSIPWEIAETGRCIIRETTVEDVDSFMRIYAEPGITKYTDGFCSRPQCEREYVKEYIEKVYEFFGYGVWTVLWKETGEVIGRVGFERPVVSAGEKAEEFNEELLMLGYMTAVPWQGKGIAGEVCRAALTFAKEELRVEQVQVVIHPQNQPSIQLAQSLGVKEWQIIEDKGERYLRGIVVLL